jgi:D-alanyl-D-alanine carboxypeptidase (penicillin-binding protein 5/6)
MKKCFIAFCILLMGAASAYGKQGFQKGIPSGKKGLLPQERAIGKGHYKTYIVMEARTGKILEGHNTHIRWPPASVTKLMLSLIVLEKLSRGELHLTDKVTTSAAASKMGGSQVYLKENEVFTLEELMKAILVASANDAAYAVGEFVAGTADEFVNLMNEKARSLNMVDTEFQTVHGLPPSKGQEEDLTSCHDLAILARALLKYSKILEWTSIRHDTFRNGQFVMNNHNKLLSKMPFVDGLKTGYYERAGYNIVATAKKGDMRLIVITMGSPGPRIRDRVVEEKLKKYFALFEMVAIIQKGESLGKEIIVKGGKQERILGVASTGFSYPVLSSKKRLIKKEIRLPETVDGGITKGQRLGEVVIKLDDERIGSVDIVSPVHVPRVGLFTIFMRKLRLGS